MFLHILTKTTYFTLAYQHSEKKHSCHTALTSLFDQWLSNINNNKFCSILFVDFANAFDVTDHDLLFKNRQCIDYLPRHVFHMHHFIQTESKLLKVKCMWMHTSDVWSLGYGVSQGPVLGWFFFWIYMNDLPLFIKACCELFTDNTTIHSSNYNLKKRLVTTESINSLLQHAKFNHICPAILIRPNLCLQQPSKELTTTKF